MNQPKPYLHRRDLLRRAGMGMAALGLTDLLGSQGLLEAASVASPLAPRRPHFEGKAKRVIHLFMNGGPAHLDTVDPKPMLARYAGRELPRPNLGTQRRTAAAFPPPFRLQRHGQSGSEVRDPLPHVASG